MLLEKTKIAALLATLTTDRQELRSHCNHINKEGDKLVATEGHMMTIVKSSKDYKRDDFPSIPGTDNATDPKDAMIDAGIFKDALSKKGKKSSISIVNDCVDLVDIDGKPAIGVTNLESNAVFSGQYIDGTYPESKSIVERFDAEKEKDHAITVRLDVKLLHKLVMAVKKSDAEFVDLTLTKSNEPVQIHPTDDDSVFYLMSMNV